MQTSIHTPAELARFWSHPEVAALRAEAARINGQKMSGKARAAALEPALLAIRDKVSELKAAS
jgi:hypothetical protein